MTSDEYTTMRRRDGSQDFSGTEFINKFGDGLSSSKHFMMMLNIVDFLIPQCREMICELRRLTFLVFS